MNELIKTIKIRKGFLITLFSLVTFFGCNESRFSSLPSTLCSDINSNGEDILCVNGEKTLEISSTRTAGKVDLLFVIDNSGSMYLQQQKMAERFNSLYQKIGSYDFRIAVITTDVSASWGNSELREGNGHGAFQDGKFLKSNRSGIDVISKESCQGQNIATCLQAEFSDIIEREETQGCENLSNYNDMCPSGDERAIYAINLAIDRGHSDFFRQDASLDIVILSDEDERSVGTTQYSDIDNKIIYPYDLPETLVSKVKEQLGIQKTARVHSIIVVPQDHADSASQALSCYTQQNKEEVGGRTARAFYGNFYADLSDPSQELMASGNLAPGHLGSICSSDYAAEMGDIGERVAEFSVKLPCSPMDGKVNLEVSPSNSSNYSYNLTDGILSVSPNPLPSQTVKWSYTCNKYD